MPNSTYRTSRPACVQPVWQRTAWRIALPASLILVLVLRGAQGHAANADDVAAQAGEGADGEPADTVAPDYQTVVRGHRAGAGVKHVPRKRAATRVERAQMDERLPRSAPDALRYEPGVFVQQTAHGQGSAFIRGLTGQQTLLMFDGIRLNNSTYRQGPNQYFFTLDSRTVSAIEVLRGGASTRYGPDALGGVIMAHPLEPPDLAPGSGIAWRPRVFVRGATADDEYGGRAQLAVASEGGWGFVGGVGGRRVGLLESAGSVRNPADGGLPWVPDFQSDQRTQRGTGFDELTMDGRFVVDISPHHRLTLAGYGYRQYDSPRTDQCPAPFARTDQCLLYEEQFRTLAYAAWEGFALHPLMQFGRATVSWQRQHERRSNNQPASAVVNLGIDDVDTWGVAFNASTRHWHLHDGVRLRLQYGADTYRDAIGSRAWLRFTDIDLTQRMSRGQYLDGSSYVYGGAYVEGDVELGTDITVNIGGRTAWIRADAPADPESGSLSIRRTWSPVVGHLGMEWKAHPNVAWLIHVDRSFRAPNLDDLTSRQQTGPGFQFENPDLRPEIAYTLESGVKLTAWPVLVDLWVFQTFLMGAVAKQPRDIEACPPETPQCANSWTRFQLRNADGVSWLRGVEASLWLDLSREFTGRATVAWTWGEGPNLADAPSDPTVSFQRRVPLSRVPPLNGTVELRWRPRQGRLALGAGMRWAHAQTRLAVADHSDARIPKGGTPGFAVVDLRATYRYSNRLAVSAVLENLLDSPYRYHGSSVNGAGRGVIVMLDAQPLAWP